LRVGEMIKQSLGQIFLIGEAKVPTLETNNITVTEVRMSPDLKNARAYVIPLGGKNTEKAVNILTEFSHLIRKALSKKVDMKFLPKVSFVSDKSFDYAEKIEKLIDAKNTKQLTNPKLLGRVKRLENGNDKYIEILRKNFPDNFNLRGIKIVLDCANGAGYIAAPKLLKDLGAKVVSIGVKPNGFNINDKCGSTFPSKIQSAVRKYKSHVGISFDGDADRIIMCDENNKIIDGDQIIAMLARRWKSKKILKGGVIGTLMSNYGLENFLKKEKIKFFRSKVGDRYVKEKMKKLNFNLGGEQSGHIILGKFATTGDGLMVALEVLFSLRKGKKASKLLNVFVPMPQILENITVKDKNIINKSKCTSAIKKANKLMSNHGRLLIRKSGTEPKIRIMGESHNKQLILKCIKLIKRSIK